MRVESMCTMRPAPIFKCPTRSEEHTSELQSQFHLHSFPTRRSSDLKHGGEFDRNARRHPIPDRIDEVADRRCARSSSLSAKQDVERIRRSESSAQCESNPCARCARRRYSSARPDRKSTRLNSSHSSIYTLSLHDALPI